MDKQQSNPQNPTRREFLSTTGSTAAATLIAAYMPVTANTSAEAGPPEPTGPTIEDAVPITLPSTVKTANFASIRAQPCSIAFAKAFC
ncbi:MAG TPA: hypothetical protein VFP64_00680 [Pyrinomonadaceae bacterium]|nr:hypothetical protein [Pyrinomonadaceae bacterium]